MDPALDAAFRAARYRFRTQMGEMELSVDVPSAALAGLLQAHGAKSMAVLTAFNPQGRRQDERRNRDAQRELLQQLTASGCVLYPGQNEDPAGRWPVEQSVLALDLDLAEAHRLAARYNQLAFLWASAPMAVPRLIEAAPER